MRARERERLGGRHKDYLDRQRWHVASAVTVAGACSRGGCLAYGHTRLHVQPAQGSERQSEAERGRKKRTTRERRERWREREREREMEREMERERERERTGRRRGHGRGETAHLCVRVNHRCIVGAVARCLRLDEFTHTSPEGESRGEGDTERESERAQEGEVEVEVEGEGEVDGEGEALIPAHPRLRLRLPSAAPQQPAASARTAQPSTAGRAHTAAT